MQIPYLADRPKFFPHPIDADDTGLIAVSQTLHAELVPQAYRCGIFPWYMENYPVLWYHTCPRAVIFPSQIKISKSMRSVLRKASWTCTLNKAFPKVMEACRDIRRRNQEGSWIHDEMIAVYNRLHLQGYVHSVEVWEGEELIGGLYGMALGKIFYGESMFTRTTNASKYGLIHLARFLETQDCTLIDCQEDTAHLRSLGSHLLNMEEWTEVLAWNYLESDFAMNMDAKKLN